MTQPQEAVGGATNDTVVAAEPTIEDRFAAAFSDQDEEDPGEPQGEPEDATALEAEVAEEDLAEAEIDDADLPPINPPVSWTAEEKEEFASLPRNVQETLTRREAEREKFVQAKAQEVKAATQKAEADAAERVNSARQAHLQQLAALLPEIPARPPASLMAQNPAQYAHQMELHDYAIAQHQYVQQVAQQIEAQQQKEAQDADQQEREAGRQLLQEKFPEYFDDAVRADLEPKFKAIAAALEYPEDQLSTFDAHDIIRLKTVSEWKAKADKLDTLMAKQMEKVRAAKALPKVSRPGVAVGKGAIANERYNADRQAMRQGDRDAEKRVFARFV